MRLSVLTDIGTTRSENQDNYWSAILEVNGCEAGIICLCDGMGGLKNGGLSSKLVVQAVRDYILSDFSFEGLARVLEDVNVRIYNMSSGDKKKIMGTTCTVLLCYKGTFNIYHVGDSRAYLIRNDESKLLTIDHSAVNMYNISKSDNLELWNKYKNKLTRCVGAKGTIQLDYIQGAYQDGDAFFLCSDGCWHYLDDYGFSFDSLDDLQGLFRKCIASGETDNITAGILFI